MTERDASRTAMATAYMRAAHQLLDAPPRILEDPLALAVVGEEGERYIRGGMDRLQSPEGRALRAHVVLRSRYAEDRLALAVARGITQYVVLGAGFDTFALRQPKWAQALRIFEVDHPGTQAVKRAKLAAAGLALPANAAFANIDFEHESLLDGLRRNGIRPDKPTLFSWLGVTMYLTREAIDAVLASVARFPAGSEIVLTFASPPESEGDAGARQGLSALAAASAAVGEPWLSHFEPAAMEAMLRTAGFAEIEFLVPEMADAAYFRQRPPDLPVPRRTTIASAVR